MNRSRSAFLTGAALALMLSTPASAGLVITFDYSSGTAAAQFGANFGNLQSAMNYAASVFSSTFSDNIHINLAVEGAAGTSILGQSSTSLFSFGYGAIRTAAINDAKSTDDATSVGAGGSVVAADPIVGAAHTWWVSKAEAKALGLVADDLTNDGTMTFGAGFTYTFDPSNRAVSGAFDFIGVAMHEMSEVMGRIGINGNTIGAFPNSYSFLDDFSYKGAGTKGVDGGAGNFFSINNGTTLLKAFNNSGGGGDSRDWASGANDSFNAFSSSGVKNDFTAVDIREMDVLGYDLAVPEPGTILLIGSGLAMIIGSRLRKRT
jgi:hypothetical protein